MPRLPPPSTDRTQRQDIPEVLISAQDLSGQLASAHLLQNAAGRRYVISDGKHALLVINPSHPNCIHVHLRILSSRFDFVDFNDCSPAELAKIAEIKAIVDDWQSGKLHSLPRSTYTPPAE